jgi:hypothetical protein
MLTCTFSNVANKKHKAVSYKIHLLPSFSYISHWIQYNIQARLLGKTKFKRINKTPDDTGSDWLELYEQDDCARLGLVQGDDYEGWLGPVDRLQSPGLDPHDDSSTKGRDGHVQIRAIITASLVSTSSGKLTSNIFSSVRMTGCLQKWKDCRSLSWARWQRGRGYKWDLLRMPEDHKFVCFIRTVFTDCLSVL